MKSMLGLWRCARDVSEGYVEKQGSLPWNWPLCKSTQTCPHESRKCLQVPDRRSEGGGFCGSSSEYRKKPKRRKRQFGTFCAIIIIIIIITPRSTRYIQGRNPKVLDSSRNMVTPSPSRSGRYHHDDGNC